MRGVYTIGIHKRQNVDVEKLRRANFMMYTHRKSFVDDDVQVVAIDEEGQLGECDDRRTASSARCSLRNNRLDGGVANSWPASDGRRIASRDLATGRGRGSRSNN